MLFPLSFIAQVLAAIANIFFFASPGVLSDVWFPLTETALASGVCVGAIIVGTYLGYIWPSLVVIGPVETYNGTTYPSNWSTGPAGTDAIEEVGHQLLVLFLGETALAVICFLFVFFAFPDRPKYPPSVTESRKRKEHTEKDMSPPEFGPNRSSTIPD